MSERKTMTTKSMQTRYNTHTLSNGLRVIHRQSASAVVYCGFEINAGSRHEERGDEGLAHFCEHVTFKGTRHRRAWHILNCLESVGGDLNAFTNKEDTVYYAAILNDQLPRAVALLCDIVFSSTYPQHEIDKEVAVICDEIESYNDTPTELIFDDFENIIFSGHPLGHNILGNAERLRQFCTADALRFTRRHYRPENMVFFADGDISFSRLVRLLEKNLQGVENQSNQENQNNRNDRSSLNNRSNLNDQSSQNHQERPLCAGGQTVTMEKGTHQSHVMVGTRGFAVNHPLRIPLYLLNNLLGGPGMNARLNLSLREKHGLVYTVESSMMTYSDTGLWCIYFGCDPHDVRHCLRLVGHELDRLVQQPLTPRQLNAAKKQLKGQIGIACDNREQFALDFGKSYLHYGWEKNVERLMQHIEEVSAEQIQQTAQLLFAPERLTTLIYS